MTQIKRRWRLGFICVHLRHLRIGLSSKRITLGGFHGSKSDPQMMQKDEDGAGFYLRTICVICG
jgi:hypothetical protein